MRYNLQQCWEPWIITFQNHKAMGNLTYITSYNTVEWYIMYDVLYCYIANIIIITEINRNDC